MPSLIVQPTRRGLDSGGERPGPANRKLLWELATITRTMTIVAVALIVCVGCWYNASGKGTWPKQIPAMNIAIIACVVAQYASISLLLSGRRAIGLRRQALLGDPGPETATPVDPYPVVVPAQVSAASLALVGGPGLLHFHRSDCPMAAGRDWPHATALQHEREGRTPCGVCRP